MNQNFKMKDFSGKPESITGESRSDNYAIATERARPFFLKCDQSEMIEKFHLPFDDSFLYIHFVGWDYRINRLNGSIERSSDQFQSCVAAGFNEVMTIYDVLGYSKKGCCLSGNFITISGLKFNTAFGSGDSFFQNYACFFDRKLLELEEACRKLGGTKERFG
ncbi:MAG: DUF3786 domain-containing protein, partial [Lachnospiraceae bacterium]|nr:DUF3786 domain-containing protein [Lachnospiraceae bacterium]